jgi:hypothetical protein
MTPGLPVTLVPDAVTAPPPPLCLSRGSGDCEAPPDQSPSYEGHDEVVLNHNHSSPFRCLGGAEAAKYLPPPDKGERDNEQKLDQRNPRSYAVAEAENTIGYGDQWDSYDELGVCHTGLKCQRC